MRKILAIVSSLFFCSLSHANFSDLYTSVNAGGSYVENVNWNGKKVSGFSAPAANIFLGAPINHYFAPEVGVGYNQASSLGHVVIGGLDFKLMAPVDQNFLIFAKIGAGLGEISTTNNGTETSDNLVTILGAGVGYRFKPLWMVTAEFNGAYFSHNVSNGHGIIGAATLGITRFWQWW